MNFTTVRHDRTPARHLAAFARSSQALSPGGVWHAPAARLQLALPRPVRHDAASRPMVRRVRAGDADAFGAFVMALSPLSRRMRFHGAINGCSPTLLQYLTQAGNPRHQAWLAVDGDRSVVGEARFVVAGDGPSAEFAIAVADDQRSSGLADRLLQTLVAGAAAAGIAVLYGEVLEDNTRMCAFLRRHGFAVDPAGDADPGAWRWQRRLDTAQAAGPDAGGHRPRLRAQATAMLP